MWLVNRLIRSMTISMSYVIPRHTEIMYVILNNK